MKITESSKLSKINYVNYIAFWTKIYSYVINHKVSYKQFQKFSKPGSEQYNFTNNTSYNSTGRKNGNMLNQRDNARSLRRGNFVRIKNIYYVHIDESGSSNTANSGANSDELNYFVRESHN